MWSAHEPADAWQQQQEHLEEQMGRYSKASGGDFTPAPAGTHVARCIKLIDLGTQTSEYQGQTNIRNQVLVMWELPNEMMKAGDDGIAKPFIVSKFYTNSLNEKATLRHDLEAWRGRAFNTDELEQFDLQNVLGVPCMISIIGKDGGGTKVGSVSALPKEMTCPAQFNEEVAFWLDEFSGEQFDALSDGIKKIIQKSPEYKEIVSGEPSDGGIADMDDDIPF